MTSESGSENTPALTVITATFNRLPYLREAVASVREQGRTDIEHLIIDGGSTDGTLEWLDSQASDYTLRVMSEPDDGVYDAWNKGIKLAGGEVISFLNSDDAYAPGAFDAALGAFAQNPEIDIVSGGAEFYHETFDPASLTRILNDTHTKELHLDTIMRGIPIINSRFFRRQIFHDVGEFSRDYVVISDKEYLIRLREAGFRSLPIQPVVYRYRHHASSLTLATGGMQSERQEEALQLSHRYMREDRRRDFVREAKRWHALRSGGMMWAQLRDGDVRAAARWAQRGWRADPLWPVHFVLAAKHSRQRERSDQR